jgi:hypothetical protein
MWSMSNYARVRATVGTGTPVSANTTTTVPFDTETFDIGSKYAIDTYRFTADEAMYVMVHASVTVYPSTTWISNSYLTISVLKNGTAVKTVRIPIVATGPTAYYTLQITDMVSLANTDYVTIQVYSSASNCTIETLSVLVIARIP